MFKTVGTQESQRNADLDVSTDQATPPVLLIRGGGAALAVDVSSTRPRILHWGSDLGPLDDVALASLLSTSVPTRLNTTPTEPRYTLIPTEYDGWLGTPGVVLVRKGIQLMPRFDRSAAETGHHTDGQWIAVTLIDDTHGIKATSRFDLDHAGILQLRTTVSNQGEGDEPVDVASLTVAVPLPARAVELVDFTGQWCRERSPQRHQVSYGTHLRHVRGGKPGLDSPYLFLAGTPGFRSRSGEVWAMHVAWSGDQQWLHERLPGGADALISVLSGGELLRAGEIRLLPGESYSTPRVLFAWSNRGTDGIAGCFHHHLRVRPHHPRTPRPLVLNSWEAVYFDHDLTKLLELVDRAAAVGVERFVLDDGWFEGRTDDSAGLGDWTVDRRRWPDGLQPLVDRVTGHGMQFGLWVEPEMVNLDSDLARAHPDWLLAPAALGMPTRHQYVLNLTQPEVWHHLLIRLDTLITQYGIEFLKWDHNRDLSEAVDRRPGADIPAVHAQTLATYRLLDTLRQRHPGLEIESCASGGGRIDLEILERTDRVWASDCNDPVERQQIQRWTSLLLPPELIGSHVGEARAHTTNRVSDTSFRLTTALFAHAGIEWDLTRCDPEELAQLAGWASMYKEFRELIHTGDAVWAEADDDAYQLHGSVSADASHALYEWAQLTTTAAGHSGRLQLPGLDPTRPYRLRIREDLGRPALNLDLSPEWYRNARAQWIASHGAVLGVAGLPMPALSPGQSILIEVSEY